MLHILTVHWRDDRWIDLQLSYFRHFLSVPYKVYAFLNFLPEDHRSKFFYASTEPIPQHAVKLNLLADMAALDAWDEDDLLMFIDGDAFPIGDVVAFGREKLEQFPLVAVQRRENNSDAQPHPCFCLTTIKFWKELGGDWKAGYQWLDARGEMVTDVGGNLLGKLRERSIEWYPMLRSNRRNLHPLFFGLYEDLVYHHGAAFRLRLSRKDMAGLSPASYLFARALGKLPKAKPLMAIRKWIDPFLLISERNRKVSEAVFEKIQTDFHFYRDFQLESQIAARVGSFAL